MKREIYPCGGARGPEPRGSRETDPQALRGEGGLVCASS